MLPCIVRLSVLVFIILCSCTEHVPSAATALTDEKKNDLTGSWRIKEIHWHTKDTTYSILKAQPGFVVFTEEAYALMWTRTKEARIAFNNLSDPSTEEMISAFQSVVFNSGSYTVSNDSITTKAAIAKVPGFEGGTQLYTFRLSEKQLYLRMFDEIYPNGDHPSWSGVFELAFHMERFAH